MTQQNASGASQQVELTAGQKATATMTAGENLVVATGTSVQGMNMTKGGALVISFSEGTTLTITNFAAVSKLSPPPTITLPSGQTIDLAQLAMTLTPSAHETADTSPTLQAKEAIANDTEAKDAGKVVIIGKPGAKEDVIVKIVPGQDYKFTFDMTEPTAVTQKGGALVISFKNGGEIIIPNYGATKGSDTDFTMSDGAKLSASEFGDMLATAAQLNAVEPAAGEGASQRGAGGGFGFGSAFQYTPFENVDPIGPLGPTELGYQAPDRQPNPGDNDPAPPVLAPTLTVQDEWIKEDSSGALDISASLNNPQANDTLTITVTGFLPGWTVDTTLSGGTYDPATGTWTITLPAGTTSFTGGPTVSPPADWDGDMPNLNVTATATRGTRTTDATDTIDVNVDAVIDGPNINGTDETTTEDTPVVLHITADAGGDTADASETLSSVTISGVPAGATLSAGTYDSATGNWTVPVASLPGLTLTPPSHFHGDIVLSVSVTDTETALTGNEQDLSDNAAIATDTFTIHVDNTIGTPTVSAADAWVYEDGQGGAAAAQVTVNASLTNPGPADQLTVTITGIPAGWTVTDLGGGTYAAGTWTITLPAGTTTFSGGPTIQPPADSDADAPNLQVTATASDGLISASANDTANVFTDAVIDGPSIDGSNASGAEDTAIPLTITVGAGGDNADGSEVLSNITLSGVPASASLNHGTDLGGGVWELTQADLVGLTITPPHNFSGDFALTVSVTDTETNLSGNELTTANNSATATDTFNVHVQNTVEAPRVSAKDVWVKEDSSVQLQINASLTDPGPNDQLVVNISGFQPGWTFTDLAGGTYDSATGTWSITLPVGTNSFSGGPTVAPPANSDADSPNLNVTVYQTDGEVTSSAGTTTNIFTDAVIDGPSIDGLSGSGPEDTAIPLTITVGAGGDNADGSEVLSNVTLSGLPAGSVLNHGTQTGPGTWVLTQADLVGLTLTPPANWSGDITATVSVTDTETNLSGNENDLGDNSATATDTFTIAVTPVPDAPTVSAPDKWVKEDGTVQLQVNANLTDTDGSESLTVSISGFLPGWTFTNLAGGTFNPATGTWTISLAPGANFSGGPTIRPPADSDADMPNLTVTATSTEGANGASASTSTTMNVYTDAVIDGPSINAPDVTGNEDTSIPLTINVGRGGDTTDGSEVLSSITITGVPSGATLNHGTKNPDGSWTLTTADLTGLTLTPEHNYNGNFTLTVSVTDTEANLSGNENDLSDNTATATDTIKVTVNPVGDDPACRVDDVRVKEDGSVALTINATMSPGSGAGEYLTVTLTGIPNTWGVNTSVSGGTYNSATGTWTITVPAGSNFSGGPTFSPPANSDVDLNGLVATVNQYDAGGTLLGSANDGASILVDAVIDGPSINAPDVTGNEDTSIPLNITVSRGGDTADGSETLSNITITGVPATATLNHGVKNPDGSWTLTTADLTGLTLTPEHNYNGNFTLTVSVTDTETNLSGSEWDTTDNTATATDTIKVTVNPVGDDPACRVDDVKVKEDGSVALTINATMSPGSGAGEYLTVTLTGIPNTWGVNTSVSGGTYNSATGTWTITVPAGSNFSGGPIFSPPANSDVDLNGLVATVNQYTAGGTLLGSASDGASILVDAVIDGPSINAPDASGEEDTPIALNITVGRGGDTTDGSETLSNVTISGVPLDATLSAGTNNGGGVWTLTTAQLPGLTITPGSAGTFNLTVSVTDTETNLSGSEWDLTDNSATATDTICLTVRPDDVPQIVDPAKRIVDETDLGPITLNGTINASFGADTPGAFSASGAGTFSASGSIAGGSLTSEGHPVTVTLSGNTYTGTANGAEVFTLKVNANGTYEFKLTGTLDHADGSNPNDAIDLKFGITATDSDGDTDTTTLTVRVLDDAPIANDDHNTFLTTDGSASGNVVTGLNGGSGAADNLSEDDDNTVTQISFGSTTVNVPSTGTASINGQYGQLTIAADGSYTYTLFPGAGTSTSVMNTIVLKDTAQGLTVHVNAVQTATGVQFTVTVVTGNADLNAFFLDIGGNGGPIFTVGSSSNNMGGTASNGFDYALEIGTNGNSDPAVTTSTFTISGLTLASLDDALIGIRATSTGPTQQGSAKLLGSANVITTPNDTHDEFVYTLTDGDGDSETAILTLDGTAPVLKVGENVNDTSTSTTPYEVGGGPGVITGKAAADVLVGDVGGSSLQSVNKDYNVVLILDVSGSMEGSKLALLKSAVNNLLTSFNGYTGGAVKIHFVTFSTGTMAESTFTVTNLAEFNAAKAWINALDANGYTNYEDPMQDAITWLQSTTGNKPIAGADTYTYFVSDGEPNRYMNNSGTVSDGSADTVMQNIHGTYNPTGTSNDDTVSEVAILKSLSTDLIGVGIGVSATTLARLDTIDKNGDALDVQNPADLSAALQGASPLNQLAAAGGDVINGGASGDVIFGDSLFTDTLATAKGLATLKGAGWDVFAQLEAGPGWTRADTINYIKTHAAELAQESVGSGGATRTGGDDTLNGGTGNDIIFGQEGRDLITGGAGNDLLSGGTGGDTFIFHNGDGVDHISDFSLAQGDKLDISDILTSFDPLNHNLHNFVTTVTSGADTLVQVDPTGTGAAFQTVVVLEGVHIDVNALTAGGNLIA